jgi:formylglycine-generating enzyme required for sulfatase activity/proteasome lid subunit RPN8/RPN11
MAQQLTQRRTIGAASDGAAVANTPEAIVFAPGLLERLVAAIRQRLPRKSFGYVLSDGDLTTAKDFVLFETNERNSGVWKERFEGYGKYFVEHDNAGFVTTPDEAWKVQKEIWARGMVEVGVFHSHIRHPANFSGVDYDLHIQRFATLWHLIVSMRNPDVPQVRAFGVSDAGVRELPILVPNQSLMQEDRLATRSSGSPAADDAIRRARRVLALDDRGQPTCTSSRAILTAIDALVRTQHGDVIDELLVHGFLRGSEQRYAEHVAPLMTALDGGRFLMGTREPDAQHYLGETPRHAVQISRFLLARVPVTQGLFAILDARRGDLSVHDRSRPVVDVSWFDATLFAMWMGCRLPTEAEWEFACGGGSEDQWCCAEEEDLPRYAWYSQNADSETHPVATREPNRFGLFDLHGNVWEWCQDVYEADYFARSPISDPLNTCELDGSPESIHRVTRGGCMHSFAEMCRTRHRFHEAASFSATDLGLRLARSTRPAGGNI